MIIGCIRTGLAQHTHAELYKQTKKTYHQISFYQLSGVLFGSSFILHIPFY
jgi:hypothetical protein